MKIYFFLLPLLLCFSNVASAQEQEAQFLYGGQLMAILPGISPYAEVPVTRNLVARVEAVMSLGLSWATETQGKTENGSGLTLAGTVAPRWYYNFGKRVDLEKSTYRNSANFLSLRSTYIPGVLFAESSSSVLSVSGFTIIPSWGLRRPLGKFIFEASTGIGFRRTGTEEESKTSGVALDLRVGIGF